MDQIKLKINEESVKPRTLEGRVMPLGSVEGSTCVSVFGKDERGNDIWVATFYDSNEAAAWIEASKTYGRAVLGASVPIPVVEMSNGEGKEGGEPAAAAS
jgi:hypothetical protein